MAYARSSLFLLLFWATVVAYGSAILLLPQGVSEAVPARLARHWGKLVLWLLGSICGLRYRAIGLEHLATRPSVLLCNHQSTWETVALRALLPLEQSWVLKQELLDVPFYGWALRRFRPIAIDRQAGRQAIRRLMVDGQARLSRGDVVVVFPEGTRVPPGIVQRFNVGGAMLACQAGVPVIPVAHNAGLFWGRGSWRKQPGCISLQIGHPISSEGKTTQEINADADRWIRQTMAALPKTP